MKRYKFLLLASAFMAEFKNVWAQQDTIADQQLKEVVVTAKLPLVEMSAGKTTYRMDASIVQGTGTLYDVLASLPGVTVDSEGGISINGKSGTQVLIDGKLTYLSGNELMTLLKSIPATNTDKIDLINQPSARYDASGNIGLIDIHMRKIKLRGMNLSVQGNGSLGRQGNTYSGASFNLRRNKFNMYMNYSYYWGKNIVDMDVDRPYLNNELRLIQDSYRKRFRHSHFVRGGFDFYPTERTEWGFSCRGNFWGQTERMYMINKVSEINLYTLTNSKEISRWNDYTAGTYFTHRLKREGGEITASADYFYYDRRRNQNVSCEQTDTLDGKMLGRIHIYAAQSDMAYPFSDAFKLQAGAKMASVQLDNKAGYKRPTHNGWRTDGTLGSHFKYTENIASAYVQGNYKYRGLHLAAGLRMEHTHVHGELSGNTAQPDSAFTKTYANLFPTLSMEYTFGETGTMQFSYGRRITRPNYGDLNPFVYIFDAYTTERGNTNLQPSFSNNFELAYLYKEHLQTVLFFSHTDDAIVKSYQEQKSGEIYVTPMNLATYYQTGLRIHAANIEPTSWWKTNITLIAMYNSFKWKERGEELKNHRWTPMIGISNQFTITPKLSAEVMVNYNGKIAVGQAVMYPRNEVNLGIQRKICKGNGVVSLFVKDLFNGRREKISMPVANRRGYASSENKATVIGVGFSWKFKQGSDAKKRRNKIELDETKRVNL